MLIRRPPDISPRDITDERLFWGRREWLAMMGMGVAAAALPETIIPVSQNLDLAPLDEEVRQAVQAAAGSGLAHGGLARALESVHVRYDFTVLDCPPASGPLTQCALYAADEVIIAVETSFFALNGVKHLLNLIEISRRETGRPRSVRALATMYDRRTSFAREVLGEIRSYFREALYDSVIAHTVRLKEASSHGVSIVDYDRSGRAFADYLGLADEVLRSSANAAADPPWELERRRSLHG